MQKIGGKYRRNLLQPRRVDVRWSELNHADYQRPGGEVRDPPGRQDLYEV